MAKTQDTFCWLVLIGLTLTTSAAALEVGPDDIRLTNEGPNGDTAFFASRPKIAYNSVDDEYFIVSLSVGSAGLAAAETELFGQRISTDGQPLGNRVRVTDAGGVGVENVAPLRFQLVYNSTDNEYLVVYQTQDPRFGDTVQTAYGRRIGANGAPIGDTFAISESAAGAGAFWPHVAYNATSNQYLVVWTDNENASTFRINGQILNAATLAVVRDDYIATATNAFSDRPNVAWDSVNNRYLVVWTNNVALSGQILDAAGDPLLPADFALSTASQGTQGISLTFNPDDQEYLVLWGDSVAAIGSEPGNAELFARRVAFDGSVQGGAPVRLSFSDGGGNAALGASRDGVLGAEPGLVYKAGQNRYLATFSATIELDGVIQSEALAALIPAGQDLVSKRGQQLISRMGGTGDNGTFRAFHPVVASRAGTDEAFVAWWGDDDRSGGVDNEIEIYGQRLDLTSVLGDGFE